MDTKIEIEAKFSIQAREVFRALCARQQLGNYALRHPLTHHYQDTYFDTAHWHLLKAGYACRQREREQDVLLTLKSARKVAHLIHKRKELEVTLPRPQSPATWPDNEVKMHIHALSQGEKLIPLFTLYQIRATRDICEETRMIAELCLDDVTLKYQTHRQNYVEAEIELQAEGTEKDLAALIAQLENLPGLTPQPLSKFERALSLFGHIRGGALC